MRVLGRLFRGKFLAMTKRAFADGKLGFRGELASLLSPAAFAGHLERCYAVNWVVYSKKPFGGPSQVLKYLACYTHRIAISNHRLISLDSGCVRFRWKDYRCGNKSRVMTLDAREFIRRFLLHVLPTGFMRIRHYGLLANAHRAQVLDRCRALLLAIDERSQADHALLPFDSQPPRCPKCNVGRMIVAGELPPVPVPLFATSPTSFDTS